MSNVDGSENCAREKYHKTQHFYSITINKEIFFKLSSDVDDERRK